MGQNVPELIFAFREAAVNYGRGDRRAANKSSRRGNELKRELVRSEP